METITINPLKIPASRICLGTWAIGGWMWGGTDEQESIKTIHAALDHGINIIDTAPIYGFGVSEEIIGKALQQQGKREKVILATKAGLEWRDNKVLRNSSPQRLRTEIEDSLQRLRTDYIDVYQIHWPDNETALEDTASTMSAFLQEGKIRAIGVSNYTPEQMEAFLKVAPLSTSQPPYNLFERNIEKDTLPFTQKKHIVSLCYGALCRGLLTGKMRLNTQFTGDDLRRIDPKFQKPRYQQYLSAVKALDNFAQKNYHKNVLALAIRWILDRGHTIALWGARHAEQLQPIKEIRGWKLDAGAMFEIDKILATHITDPVGPEFMAPPEGH